MHDQKKKERDVLTPAQKAAKVAEHERVGVLYKAVLQTAKTHNYSLDTLRETEGLLLAVPEAYTAYNCRRRALEAIWKAKVAAPSAAPSSSGVETADATAPTQSRQAWLQQELKLDSKLLHMNYKNYSAFVHRHWIFDQIESLAEAELMQMKVAVKEREERGEGSTTAPAIGAPTFALLRQLLKKERAQCEQLLQLDERNFHAWNYRRWVLSQEYRANDLTRAYLPQSEEDPGKTQENTAASLFFTPNETAELSYTTQKIRSNFSNYSAWHQRSLALKAAVARWQQELRASENDTAAHAACQQRHRTLFHQLEEDVRFLEQAVYCDPNDQSAWFYAPFVLAMLRDEAHQTAQQFGESGALADVFVHAVIELVAEMDCVGKEDECYMPYYFVLDQLIHLQANSAASAAVATRYLEALQKRVPSLSREAMAATATAGDPKDIRQRCFGFLHARLCAADAMRRGLYDDMLKRASA